MRHNCLKKLARRQGFEPRTYRFVACCSIQLSYQRTQELVSILQPVFSQDYFLFSSDFLATNRPEAALY